MVYVIDHMLDHVLDYMLNHIIIGLVIMALPNYIVNNIYVEAKDLSKSLILKACR